MASLVFSTLVLLIVLSEAGFVSIGVESFFGTSNNPKTALSEARNSLGDNYTVNGTVEYAFATKNNENYTITNNFVQILDSSNENLLTSWIAKNRELSKSIIVALAKQDFLIELYRDKNKEKITVKDEQKWISGSVDDLILRPINWDDFIADLEGDISNSKRDGGSAISGIKTKKYQGRVSDSIILKSIFPWIEINEGELIVDYYIGARDRKIYQVKFVGNVDDKEQKIRVQGKYLFSSYNESASSIPLPSAVEEGNLKSWSQQKGLISSN